MTAPKVEQESVSEGVCELYQLVFQSALFLQTGTDCSVTFAQVFSKRVIHGIESQHSFNLVAEQCSALNKPMRSLPSFESLKRSKIS